MSELWSAKYQVASVALTATRTATFSIAQQDGQAFICVEQGEQVPTGYRALRGAIVIPARRDIVEALIDALCTTLEAAPFVGREKTTAYREINAISRPYLARLRERNADERLEGDVQWLPPDSTV